ncbi:NAD kinase [Saccharicrinis sp. FJH54]|uniref:NAD kinase n=1 Tax=Saccharicrinis sp. FJH54 TaxID=3344665 RepID=UPI0035D4B8D4
MRIALFGREITEEYKAHFGEFIRQCQKAEIHFEISELLIEDVKQHGIELPSKINILDQHADLKSFDFVFSIGGDGTFLRSARLVGDSGIPIIGINTGRLGFLADVTLAEINEILDDIISGDYILEKRGLIKLHSDCNSFDNCNYALNDISVLRRDTSSLIVIHVFIDDQFLNSYWADGLIISTPTGSTAYSMSAGGPIVLPQSNSLVLTPLAPHSLTVRPLVIPDAQKIKINIESRSSNYLVSVDSHSMAFDINKELLITKADFTINVLKRKNNDFYETLRNKLLWGQDKRNQS